MLKKSSTKETLTLFIFSFLYAIVLLGFWLTTHMHSPFLGKIATDLPINELCDMYKGGDVYTYCSVGRDFVSEGFQAFVSNVNSFQYWVPGQFLNFSIATFLMGTEAPIFPALAVHMYVMWLIMLITTGYILNRRIGKIGYIIPMVLFVLPEFRNFLFITGIYGSDPYGAAYLMLAFAMLLFLKSIDIRSSVIIGVLLSVSAYYRSLTETMILIMIVGAMFAILYFSVKQRMLYAVSFWKSLTSAINYNKHLLIILAIAILLTVPWRVFLFIHDNHRLVWTRNINFEIQSLWFDSDKIDQWFLDSGGALACSYAPEVCKDFHLRGLNTITKHEKVSELIKVFKHHSMGWLLKKSDIFVKQWIGPYGGIQTNWSKCIRILLLIVFFMHPLYFCIKFLFSKKQYDITRVVVLGSCLVVSLVLILLVHIEQRYLYPFKILAMLFSIDMLLMLKEQWLRNIIAVKQIFMQRFVSRQLFFKWL